MGCGATGRPPSCNVAAILDITENEYLPEIGKAKKIKAKKCEFFF